MKYGSHTLKRSSMDHTPWKGQVWITSTAFNLPKANLMYHETLYMKVSLKANPLCTMKHSTWRYHQKQTPYVPWNTLHEGITKYVPWNTLHEGITKSHAHFPFHRHIINVFRTCQRSVIQISAYQDTATAGKVTYNKQISAYQDTASLLPLNLNRYSRLSPATIHKERSCVLRGRDGSYAHHTMQEGRIRRTSASRCVHELRCISSHHLCWQEWLHIHTHTYTYSHTNTHTTHICTHHAHAYIPHSYPSVFVHTLTCSSRNLLTIQKELFKENYQLRCTVSNSKCLHTFRNEHLSMYSKYTNLYYTLNLILLHSYGHKCHSIYMYDCCRTKGINVCNSEFPGQLREQQWLCRHVRLIKNSVPHDYVIDVLNLNVKDNIGLPDNKII